MMCKQEIISHPRPKFLTQTGVGYHSSKAEDCQSNGHPDLEGRTGTEDRQHDCENSDGEKVSTSFRTTIRAFRTIDILFCSYFKEKE